MPATLSIDDSISRGAAARAKKDGLSLSAVARLLFTAYTEGRISISARGVDPDDVITDAQAAELDRVRRAMKKGKLPAGYVPLEKIAA